MIENARESARPEIKRSCAERLAALSSPDGRRRRPAIRYLEHKDQLPCVISALENPETPRNTVRLLCEILYRVRWPEAVPVLIGQLSSPDPSVRSVAADALGVIGDKSAGPALMRLLGDRREPKTVRDTVALALGVMGYRPAWKSLVKHLHDPEQTVRHCAAKALMFLDESRAIPALEEAMSKEPVARVREQMADAVTVVRDGVAERSG